MSTSGPPSFDWPGVPSGAQRGSKRSLTRAREPQCTSIEVGEVSEHGVEEDGGSDFFFAEERQCLSDLSEGQQDLSKGDLYLYGLGGDASKENPIR